MFPGKSGNVNFDGYGTNRWPEVEEATPVSLDAEPVGQISSICYGRRESDNSQFVVGVRRDEVGSRDDDLEDGASILTQQMDFVDDDESNGLNVVSSLPRSRDTVPLLRRRYNHTRILWNKKYGQTQ